MENEIKVDAKKYLQNVPYYRACIKSYSKELDELKKLTYNKDIEKRKAALSNHIETFTQLVNAVDYYVVNLLEPSEAILVRKIFFEANDVHPRDYRSVAIELHYDYGYVKNKMSLVYKKMQRGLEYYQKKEREEREKRLGKVVTSSDTKNTIIKLEKH